MEQPKGYYLGNEIGEGAYGKFIRNIIQKSIFMFVSRNLSSLNMGKYGMQKKKSKFSEWLIIQTL
jgi:hypothetical protein